MKTNDARKLSSDQQKLLRIKAVDMVFKHGYTQRATAKALSVSKTHVNRWCKAFEEGGYEALELGRRGRRLNEKRLLKPYQCAILVNIIKDKTPDQEKMPFVLWERVAVRDLIKRKFGITIALRTVSEYLKRWGMTPQRPIERAREQSSAAVKTWLEETYPEIKTQAKKEGAVILWSDETGVQNCANTGRSFAPKGKTPIIKKQGKRLRTNMISAISNKGHVRFMVYSSKMTQQVFMLFLRRVIKTFDQKVFMIVDNLKVHHGKLVKKWLGENTDQIELFFIPSYSPELNPDEYLNRDLKKNVNRTLAPRTEADLKRNLISFMRKLQKLPSRICKYFNSKYIAYASA
jgi:transposase